MITTTNRYEPDYAVPPGWILKERLDAHGLSSAELARRCGRSAKLISEIVAGKAPVEPRTALQLEKVLGVAADIWLGIEKDYQLHRARVAAAQEDTAAAAWVKSFPVDELVKRKVIDRPASDGLAVPALLSFFSVASIDAWKTKYGESGVAYRHSPSFESDTFVLATWRRLAEIDAAGQACADYRESAFRDALQKARHLTCATIPRAIKDVQKLCNEAGVAVSLIKPILGMRVSGAAWWFSARRPIIALSVRHRTDDHLWFSLFHEAAHIVLHGKKHVFVDGFTVDRDGIEAEADEWASNFLLPRPSWRRFVERRSFRAADVRRLADEQDVAPGIVVGRLQHEGLVPWSSKLNRMKKRLQWTSK